MAKILIVEDDKFLRDLLSARLRKEKDIEVSVAEDGEEGLKKIKEEKPNLVLLDLIMPGIDGFEVLKKAKERTKYQQRIEEAVKSVLTREEQQHVRVVRVYKNQITLKSDSSSFTYEANLKKDAILTNIKKTFPQIEGIKIKTG